MAADEIGVTDSVRIEGSSTFMAEPAAVFRVFTDPAALKQATPGCQSLEPAGDDRWEAVLKVGVAGITGTYKGALAITDQFPPEHYKLALAGQGAPGYVRGTGEFSFNPTAGGQTEVRYVWDVEIGGLVASVGQRVLSGVGKMLIGQFMQAMGKSIQASSGS